MPAQPVVAVQDGARQEEGGFSNTLQKIARGLVIFYLANFAMQYFFGKTKPLVVPSFEDTPSTSGIVSDYNPVPQNIAPIWPMNSSLDLSIYVSPSLAMPPLHHMPSDSLVLHEEGFKLGDWKEKRVIDTTFPVPKEVQHNSTLWAHFYVALHGKPLDPTMSSYNVKDAYHFFRPLNHILAKKKVVKTKKLLGGGDEQEDGVVDSPKGAVFASYYHPNFTMSFVPDSGVQSYPKMHPAVRQYTNLEATGARDASGQNGWYYPTLYTNTFWQLRDHMTELNTTVKKLPIHIELNNLANWKFAIYASIDDNVKANQRQVANGGPVPAGGDGSEFEEFKRILMDTNVYLLSTTFVVTILHTIFEMLAFKNDVSHWRKKKDNIGVSVRTILANVFMQAIIFLYLIDNSDGTSWMILFGQGMGIAVEAWKITRAVNVRVRPAAPGALIPYRVTFEDKHKLSETEKKTKEYDEIAFKYLYMVAVPLLIAYAVYSVLYETHKGWYSFVLTTLVGSVYAYGFLMMVPSLYINYRLKSVAHMPGRAMTYKFLNTFIDDLFAFTIKMPTLHRLATLRDDVIFFIYIYQNYKYKVDHTRINEFGQGGDEEELEEKTASKPLTAPPDADAEADKKADGKSIGMELVEEESRKRDELRKRK